MIITMKKEVWHCCWHAASVFTAAPVAVKADNVSISTNQTPTGTYSSYTKSRGAEVRYGGV